MRASEVSDSDCDSAVDSDSGGHDREGAPGTRGRKRHKRQTHGPPMLVVFWRALMLLGEYADEHVGVFCKLAEILMCMVGTSVEDERLFSTLSFVHNKQRNRLDGHLEACVRAKAQQLFSEVSFSSCRCSEAAALHALASQPWATCKLLGSWASIFGTR